MIVLACSFLYILKVSSRSSILQPHNPIFIRIWLPQKFGEPFQFIPAVFTFIQFQGSGKGNIHIIYSHKFKIKLKPRFDIRKTTIISEVNILFFR